MQVHANNVVTRQHVYTDLVVNSHFFYDGLRYKNGKGLARRVKVGKVRGRIVRVTPMANGRVSVRSMKMHGGTANTVYLDGTAMVTYDGETIQASEMCSVLAQRVLIDRLRRALMG